jgi:hypothetical protein
MFDIGGRRMTLKEWSRAYRVDYHRLYHHVVTMGRDIAYSADLIAASNRSRSDVDGPAHADTSNP